MGIIDHYYEESSKVIASLSQNLESVKMISKEIYDNNIRGGKILIAGNGGSCADAEHFAGELLCTFKAKERDAFAAISLGNNSSAITAWSNDFDYNSFFVRQVKALGKKNDILFLITTGGGNKDNGASMNLVFAAEKARKLGLKIFCLSGKGGGILQDFSDICITVKSNETSIIQEGHIALIHGICHHLDELCGGYVDED